MNDRQVGLDSVTTSVAVVGSSFAAMCAVVELRRRGAPVLFMPDFTDSGGLESYFEVPPNPLRSSTVSGLEFGQIADRELPAMGVEMRDGVTKIRLERGTWRMESGTCEVKAALLVHAPYGHEAGLPALDVVPWLGRGVSKDAWSDASFYRGRDVVVAGSGYRAAEQALLVAASGVRAVLLVCEAPPRFGDLGERVRSHPRITLRTGSTIVGIESSDRRHLDGIVVATAEGARSEHPCSCVFLAMGPYAHAALFASAEAVEQGLGEGRLFGAGLAAGVPHGDFPAQAADAVRVVGDVMRRLHCA